MTRILVLEDDALLGEGLRFDLGAEGYDVLLARSVAEAAPLVEQGGFALALLDVNLPDGSGYDVCRSIKRQSPATPVVFLTANDLEADEARGFDLGADDFITKPFSMSILHRRLAAVLRRAESTPGRAVYTDGVLTVDFDSLRASAGQEILLTPTEFKLLRCFVESAGRVLTREMLLERLWDKDGNFVDDHALTVNINRLRSKIERAGRQYIKTVYGVGYQWLGARL